VRQLLGANRYFELMLPQLCEGLRRVGEGGCALSAVGPGHAAILDGRRQTTKPVSAEAFDLLAAPFRAHARSPPPTKPSQSAGGRPPTRIEQGLIQLS
jgi:hypothetical protein